MAYEIAQRKLMLNHDGLSICTEVYQPKDAKAPEEGWPAAVISHGFRGNRTHGVPYATAFASEGYVAVIFDFCGGGPGNESSGSMDRMSVETERQDLLCVLDYVRGLPEVDASRVALMGMSQGGYVSTMAACQRPADVKALVLFYSAYALRDDALALFPEASLAPMTYSHMGVTLGRIYAVDAIAWDPLEHMAAYSGPVHIWHGDADTLAKLPDSERAVATFPQAGLTVVPGAGHGFGERRVEIIPEVLEFLAREV